jgi:hypothetical protein
MPLFFDKSSLTTGKQAQQSYRFVLNVKGIDVALIRSVISPKYKVDITKYPMLEYEFAYPGKPKWDPVSFEILQIVDKDTFTTTIGFFLSKLYDSAYYASPMGIGTGKRDVAIPNALYTTKDTIASFVNYGNNNGYVRQSTEGTVLDFSKQKLTSAIGTVIIKSLDEEGKEYDSWRLNGAFITSVTPTDFSYENEKVSTVKIDLSYDWADYGFRGVFAEQDSVSRILGI